MKVIFLDIDGVLVTPATKFRYFDPDCVLNFEAVFRYIPEAKIVITSTWRLGKETVRDLRFMMKWGALKRLAEYKGLSDAHWDRVIGRTDRLFVLDPQFNVEVEAPRGHEITEWLKNFPEVDGYCVIDDDKDIHPHEGHFVQTDSELGFQAGDIEKTVEILKKPWKNIFFEEDENF